MASSFSRVLALLDPDDLLLLKHRFADNQMMLSTLKDIDKNDLKKIFGVPADRYLVEIFVAKSMATEMQEDFTRFVAKQAVRMMVRASSRFALTHAWRVWAAAPVSEEEPPKQNFWRKGWSTGVPAYQITAKKALELYKTEADAGNPCAMYNLAYSSQYGALEAEEDEATMLEAVRAAKQKAKKWFWVEDGTQQGPVSTVALISVFQRQPGLLAPVALSEHPKINGKVWCAGMGSWSEAGDVPVLRDHIMVLRSMWRCSDLYGHTQQGPFSTRELSARFADGRLDDRDFIFGGLGDWRAAPGWAKLAELPLLKSTLTDLRRNSQVYYTPGIVVSSPCVQGNEPCQPTVEHRSPFTEPHEAATVCEASGAPVVAEAAVERAAADGGGGLEERGVPFRVPSTATTAPAVARSVEGGGEGDSSASAVATTAAAALLVGEGGDEDRRVRAVVVCWAPS